jgi:hypothetical protein
VEREGALMPNAERGLITSIIDAEAVGDYLSVIRPHWFFDADCRRAWGIAEGHYRTQAA